MRSQADWIKEEINQSTPVMFDFAGTVEKDCRAIISELLAISEANAALPKNPAAEKAAPPAREPKLKASEWRDCTLVLRDNVTAAVRGGAHRPVSPNPSVRRVFEELLAADERGTDLESLRSHLNVTAERKRSLLTEARTFLRDTFDVPNNSDPIPKLGVDGGWICLVHLTDGIK